MERGDFEDQWKKAFEDGEVEPSDQAWSAIEGQLIAAENKEMRGKVVFYQRLAAASLIFAALMSAMGFYYWRSGSQAVETLAALNRPQNTIEPDQHQTATVLKNNLPDNNTRSLTVMDRTGNPQSEKSMKSGTSVTTSDESPATPFYAVVAAQPSKMESTLPEVLPYDQLAGKAMSAEQPLVMAESPVINKPEEEIQAPELADPVTDELKKENETKRSKEALWAALNLSAGNYTPGGIGGSTSPIGPQQTAIIARGISPINTQAPVGSAYSVGFGIGKRVAGRWMVLSGLNYINESLGYTSNQVATSPTQTQAYLKNLASANAGSTVTFTSPYQINSVLEFVSIPVQAGYLILDRKLGFQVNAGVASDFLLRSTLQDQSGQAAKQSQGPGDESPYRSVNFAGLLSTELSLRLSSLYRISVVPGIRYMLNPATKSGTSNPYVTDIGFRFRYILK